MSSAITRIVEQLKMSIEVRPMDFKNLPLHLRANKADESILVQSEPDEDAVANGEGDPFELLNLSDVQENLSRLIEADDVVLRATKATLVLSYPLEVAAIRLIRPPNGKSFTRRELVILIDETYREVYRLESNSQSSPTPPIHERVGLENRPSSDGIFRIWGHDLDDLSIQRIRVYRNYGKVWLVPSMCS
jgi:hypothetical protein